MSVEKESKSQKFQAITTGLSLLIIPVILGYYGNSIQESIQEKQLLVQREINDNMLANKYIELATNILKEKPSKENRDLRKWAVEVINYYSKVKLSQTTQENLIEISPISFANDYIFRDDYYTFSHDGNSNGFDLEIEVYENNKWEYYAGRCVVGNATTMQIPINKKVRWRTSAPSSSKKGEWKYL